MVEDVSEEEIRKRQFIGFVSLLANSAMQQLGKLANPFTGKIERNLDGAKATIDMIEMLKAKTKGNLSADEQQVLDINLSNLQLNYVDELKRKDETAATAGEPGSDKESKGPEAEE
jgi:hypothetical protein